MVFSIFVCDSKAVEGESYLRVDYRISCDSDKRIFFKAYARVMFMVSRSFCGVTNRRFRNTVQLCLFRGEVPGVSS